MSLHYLTVTPTFEFNKSNIDTYVVCFNTDQNLGNVASFVYNHKDTNASKYSILPCTTGTNVHLVQRYNAEGLLENVQSDSNNHVYLVSLIDAAKESSALNETMKQVIKM